VKLDKGSRFGYNIHMCSEFYSTQIDGFSHVNLNYYLMQMFYHNINIKMASLQYEFTYVLTYLKANLVKLT